MPTQEQINQLLRQHLSDTISAAQEAYLDSINSLPPIKEPTIADDIAGILFWSLIIISPFLLAAAIGRIRVGLRMRRDPAFRAKWEEDMAYLRRMHRDRRLRQEEKAAQRARRERARQGMSPEARQLRNIYWLLFWQGLGRRK